MMNKKPIFQCKYCNYTVERMSKDRALKIGQEHLLEEHEQRIRSNYDPNLQRRKCQEEGCNVYVKKDLYCAHGHDNIDSYAEWLAHHFTKER